MKKIYLLLLMIISSTMKSFGNHGNEEIHGGYFSPFIWVLLIILVITFGIILYMYLSKSSSSLKNDENFDAFHFLKARFAKGEINKDIFSEIGERLERDDDNNYVETAKLRLAKGEITITEYDEMCNLLKDE